MIDELAAELRHTLPGAVTEQEATRLARLYTKAYSKVQAERGMLLMCDALGIKRAPHYPAVPWPLPNAKLVTANDYWNWRGSYFDFKAECWSSARKFPDGSNGHVLMFFVDSHHMIGGGFGVVTYYSGPKAKTVEYYRWADCDHDFSQENIGNCLNRYTCAKCKRFYDIDSSD